MTVTLLSDGAVRRCLRSERPRTSSLARLAPGWMVHVPDDLEPEASHARHLSRPRQQAHLADVEIAQDLRTDAIVAQIHSRFRWRLIRQGTLPQLLRRFRPMQQNQDAATCFGDSHKRGWNRPGVRAASVIEKIDHGEWLVDTNQRLAIWRNLT